MRRRIPTGLPFASIAALVAALVLLVAALWGAFRVTPLPRVERPRADPDLLLAASAGETVVRDSAALDVGLTSDPFSPDRRLPDEAADARPARRDTSTRVAAPAVRLLGTVVRGGNGFALCQLATDVPRIVHVGERLGDLTLVSLEQGRAVFRTAEGTRLLLSLSQPGT